MLQYRPRGRDRPGPRPQSRATPADRVLSPRHLNSDRGRAASIDEIVAAYLKIYGNEPSVDDIENSDEDEDGAGDDGDEADGEEQPDA